jgi:hypothetical protein
MRRSFTLLVAIVFSTQAISQSLQIELSDNTNVTGTCIQAIGSDRDFEIVEDLVVRNISGTDKEVRVKRTEIGVNCNTSHAVCWGVCPPATNSCTEVNKTSGLTETIAAGGTNSSLAGHHYPDDNVGYSIYRYTAFVDGDPTDEAYVDIVFEHGESNPAGGCLLSIKNTKKINLSVSPNPATNQIKVVVSEYGNYNIQLINLLGKVVLEKLVNSSKAIDVTSLERGVYFVKITDALGNNVNSKKIVLE